MAAGSFQAYHEFTLRMARNEFNFLSNTILCALATSDYTPNLATHADVTDLTNEVAGGGDYTRQTLGTKTITKDGSGRTVIDAADVNFGTDVTISAKYLVLFNDTADPKYLMGYVDLNDGVAENVSSTNSDFRVEWHQDGIWRLTANSA